MPIKILLWAYVWGRSGRGSILRTMLALVIWHEEVIINAASRISYKVLETKTLKMNEKHKLEILVIVFFLFCNETIDRKI